MTTDEFAQWLEAKLNGSARATATAETMQATEIINGELRPTVVAIFPSNDVFVISIAKAAA